MKLVKTPYIHKHIIFNESETDILISASKIISVVRSENIHSCGAEDEYLNELAEGIVSGISELLDNYRNEYGTGEW